MSTSPEKTYRVSVNPDHRSSTWWDYARARFDAPASLAPLLAVFGADEVRVDTDDAVVIRRWAARVPGWDDEEPPILIGNP